MKCIHDHPWYGNMPELDSITEDCHYLYRLLDWGATVDSLSQSMLGPPKEHEVGIGPLRAWPGGVAVSR